MWWWSSGEGTTKREEEAIQWSWLSLALLVSVTTCGEAFTHPARSNLLCLMPPPVLGFGPGCCYVQLVAWGNFFLEEEWPSFARKKNENTERQWFEQDHRSTGITGEEKWGQQFTNPSQYTIPSTPLVPTAQTYRSSKGAYLWCTAVFQRFSGGISKGATQCHGVMGEIVLFQGH